MLNPAGRYDENSAFNGQLVAPSPEEMGIPKIDFYGAILRRKFIVILFAIFGAGVGYLVYSQAKPFFASSLRLMIWVQTPPTIVNGEIVPQTVSMAKQQSLIASNLVLSSAIRSGEFEKLDTFKGSLGQVGALKNMLKIMPVEKNADALDLTLTGPVGEELPQILEQIVEAYKTIIEDDTLSAGKEAIGLIERLQQRLEGDQKADQSKYYSLLKNLNLTSENEAGKWVNPFTLDIQRLKSERDVSSKLLEELDQKLKALRAAFEGETNASKQLMLIEARKALQFPDEPRGNVIRVQGKLDALDGRIFELTTQRDELLRQFGPRHQTIASLENSLKAFNMKRSEMVEELERLDAGIETKIEGLKKDDSQSDTRKKDADLLELYETKLTFEQNITNKQFDKVSEEIQNLETRSKVIAADMAEVNMLKAQINERRDSVAKILEKLSAINVLSTNYTTTKVRVIDPASGAIQVAPKLMTYLSIAILVASMLGVGLAILVDQSDLAYRTPLDIQHSLGVPVICKIPKIITKKALPGQTASPMLVTAFHPQSPASETLRAARTALLFAAHQNNSKVFLFSSPSPGDGKSTISSNLAVSLAQAKKRVVLVDADFRRPRVQQNFGIDIEPGCVEVLEGRLSLDEAIRPCEFQSNLFLLTSGGRPKDAAELIASTEFADMIGQLREKFEIVIIDSPPILPVADSTSLSSVVDGIFLVIRIRKGVMIAASKAKERLDMVQAKILGVIVNGMDENVYYSEYGMYYRGAYYSGSGRYYENQNSNYAETSVQEANRSGKNLDAEA
ncbi:MAG: polysaccharide biosynthesis tyrosine autokinase [Planctomycetota bacterium]|nr:polysaccharide biosynthesis tyrosine autokinase [Planctomycetota bacterium]